MSSLNKVFLMGNLTRDPDIRYTPKGTAVGDLGMAINITYKAQDGSEKEETTFVDVVVWGRQAETCGQYLSKGAPIFVEGRLQLDQWEDKEGQKKSRLRIRAERVQFLGRPKNAEYRDTSSGNVPEPAGTQSKNKSSNVESDEFPVEDDIPF